MKAIKLFAILFLFWCFTTLIAYAIPISTIGNGVGNSGGGIASTPAFVAAASAAATASVPTPVGLQLGDWVECEVSHTATAVTVPDTWAHLAAQAAMNGGGVSDIFGHCVSNDPNTYTFANAITASVCCAAYRSTHCNMDPVPTSGTANSTTPQVPAITTTTINEIVIGLMDVGNTGFTAPSTTETQRAFVAFAGGVNYGCWIGDVPQAAATTAAADVGSFSSANSYLGWRTAIR